MIVATYVIYQFIDGDYDFKNDRTKAILSFALSDIWYILIRDLELVLKYVAAHLAKNVKCQTVIISTGVDITVS